MKVFFLNYVMKEQRIDESKSNRILKSVKFVFRVFILLFNNDVMVSFCWTFFYYAFLRRWGFGESVLVLTVVIWSWTAGGVPFKSCGFSFICSVFFILLLFEDFFFNFLVIFTFISDFIRNFFPFLYCRCFWGGW